MTAIMSASHARTNPFFTEFNTPFQSVPFNEIRDRDYAEAIEAGLKRQEEEIDAIVANPQPPTFANTIAALERSGDLLERVTSVLFNLTEAATTDTLDALATRYTPILSEAGDRVYQNQALWNRVQEVYRQRDSLNLDTEDAKLLDNTRQAFLRSGAALSETDRQTYTRLGADLSASTLAFGQHVLKETQAYEMPLESHDDLAGLPDFAISQAREKAEAKGMDGWLIDLTQPSYFPFMRYSARRDLRERLYRAYNRRACQGGENDNRDLLVRIVNDRLAMARLFGKPDYASHRLERSMAESEERVYALLDDLRERYLPAARAEVAALQAYARQKEGDPTLRLQPWDLSYYSEKYKVEKYAIDDQALKPYFALERVKDGVFWLANRLYGLRFERNDSIQKYHPDVEVYEVYDTDGTFMALLYADFFPREGKQGGAWMTEFRGSWRDGDGSRHRPLISIVMNVTPPTGGDPALLTYGDVTTFLHEFGHALHGILSDTRYNSLSGTNVYRDFVEMPSQLMENFAGEPEFLKRAGTHYRTGEPIPMEYVERIKASRTYMAAYDCVRQLSFGYLDMAWHTLRAPYSGDVSELEKRATEPLRLLDPAEGACMSVQFTHLFAGGYAAGYYSYKWSEVLDADGFAALKEAGLFDPETCGRLRAMLSKGGTVHPALLYRTFAGRDPDIRALLRRDGIEPAGEE